MRIGVMGTQCIGKSTYIREFLKEWPQYTTNNRKHTDYIKEKNLILNENGNEQSQKFILDFLVEQIMSYKKEDKVILDRTVLDNLAYTLWLNANGKVENSFVRETINIVKESLVFYDIILFFPLTNLSPIPLEENGIRSINTIYREEIDNIFKSLMQKYHSGSTTYFPFDNKLGCPGIVEIFGNRDERIVLTKMYINKEGEIYGEKDSLLAQ